MAERNVRVVLASRPQGPATLQNFRVEEVDVPALGDGQLLVRNQWLSLDPYMRGRMNDEKSYADPQPLNETMVGGTVGEVVQSRHRGFAVGDIVVGRLGWQHFGVSNGEGLRKVPAGPLPLSVYLGCVGMPGVTAWIGLNEIVAPKAGETVVVSAASGAVGSVVGQLAKFKGCKVIGVAGGAQKCAYVRDELGFDACIDYREGNLAAQLKRAAPQGIDGYFENVGGEVFDAVLQNINAFGRIAVCGLIAGYNGTPIPIHSTRSILLNRLLIQGFIVSERPASWPKALEELGALVASGKLKYRETIAQGLRAAPEAFLALMAGRNFGKQLVKLG